MSKSDIQVHPMPVIAVRYRVLAIACVLAVVTYLHRIGFMNAGPDIKRDLGFDDKQIGYLGAAFFVAYGLFQVPGGALADRFGGRHLLTILVFAWSLLTAAVAVAAVLPHEWAYQYLLANRFLFGLVQAGGFPVLARVLADWMPPAERGFAQGSVWTFSRLGGALSPLVLLYVSLWCGGWPTTFALIAGLGLLWCAGFWPWFRDRQTENSKPTGGGPWAQFATFPYRNPSVWAVCVMYGCAGFSGNVFVNMMAVYLRDHRHLAKDLTANLCGLPLAAGAVACVGGGLLSDWIIRGGSGRLQSRRLVGGIGMAGAGLAFAAVPAVDQTWLLGLLLMATFFGNDLSMGPAWAACADIGEEHAGALSGAMNMIGSFTAAGGNVLAGKLFRAGQPDQAFAICAAVWLLGAVFWLGVRQATPMQKAG